MNFHNYDPTHLLPKKEEEEEPLYQNENTTHPISVTLFIIFLTVTSQ